MPSPIPPLITVLYDGTEKTLKDWRMAGARYEENNQAGASFGCNIIMAQDGDDVFPYGAKITLKIGGAPVFVGYRMRTVRMGSAKMEALQYKFGSIWDHILNQLVFMKIFNDPAAEGNGSYRSQVVLGESLANDRSTTNRLTMAEQLAEIIYYAADQARAEMGSEQFDLDPDFITGSFSGSEVLGWGGLTPLDTVNDMMCSECVKRLLRWVYSASAWFDYGGDVPLFNAKPRQDLAAVTLPWLANVPGNFIGRRTDFPIERRDDLVPTAIDFKYRINSTVNGAARVITVDDAACPIGATNPGTGVTSAEVLDYCRRVGSVIQTYDFEGLNVTFQSATITVAAFAPVDLAMWRSLFPELNDQVAASNITGLAINSATVDGIDLGAQPNYVIGNVPDWLAAKYNFTKGTVRGNFSYTVNTKAIDGSLVPGVTPIAVDKSVELWFCNAPVGTATYQSAADISGANETVPLGLANFIYQIEKVPHYDGRYVLKEQECSGLVRVGNVLNVSGGRAEWLTMNAQVQMVTMDFESGVTEITFGAPKHLGPGDMIERVRTNRGPRMYYLVGGNLSNASSGGGAVDAGDPKVKNSTTGGDLNSFMLFPSALPLPPAGTEAPGVSIDSRNNPDGGKIYLQAGLAKGKKLYPQEVNLCAVDGTRVKAMAVISDVYPAI